MGAARAGCPMKGDTSASEVSAAWPDKRGQVQGALEVGRARALAR